MAGGRPGAMQLDPYVAVDGLPFSTGPAALAARLGPPRRRTRNSVGLEEHDHGDAVYRFQDSGRLEEVTQRVAVLHLQLHPGALAVPWRHLRDFVVAQDPGRFERAGYLVSPRFGFAFVPDEPPWLTALARHCIPAWRSL